MSRKKDRKGRSKPLLADFVGLERYLLRSEAYKSMSYLAKAAYIEVAFRYTGANNGTILLSCDMLAAALQVSKDTASRALRELTARGFVEVAKGASFNRKIRHCTEWRLTAFRCDVTGAIPSKSFMRWKPEIQNTVRFIPPHGTTHRTGQEITPTKQTSRYDSSDRQGQNPTSHGPTHRTPLKVYHTAHSPTAQRGVAPQRADASASLNTLTDPPETWTFVSGQPLAPLAELSDKLDPAMWSWRAPPDSIAAQTAALLAAATAGLKKLEAA